MTAANPMHDHRWWLRIHDTAVAQAFVGYCYTVRMDRYRSHDCVQFTIRYDGAAPEDFTARSVTREGTFVDDTAEARAWARWDALLAEERARGLPVTVRAAGESGDAFVERHVAAHDAWIAEQNV